MSSDPKEKGTMTGRIGDLPHAIDDGEELDRHLAGRRPAVFLDYDGTPPIVDHPEDALISESMRDAVRGLAERCPVCVVSGRDRRVVQELMGVDDLIVAGSHGFDIWSPDEGTIQHEADEGTEGLRDEVKARLREEIEPIEDSLVEPKSVSMAVHYRLVSEEERPKVKEIVDALLAEHPDELKVTPGQDGLRDPAQDRLGQGQGRLVSARSPRARPRRRSAHVPGRRQYRRARV